MTIYTCVSPSGIPGLPAWLDSFTSGPVGFTGDPVGPAGQAFGHAGEPFGLAPGLFGFTSDPLSRTEHPFSLTTPPFGPTQYSPGRPGHLGSRKERPRPGRAEAGQPANLLPFQGQGGGDNTTSSSVIIGT